MDDIKQVDNFEEITKCPECNSPQLARDYEHGELVCVNCGIVVSENYVDQGPEWRAYDSEQNSRRSRTGSPSTFTVHDKGLSTEISWKNKDSFGKSLPSKTRGQLYRMRKWQKRIRISNGLERNLAVALQEMDRIASNMDLPDDVRESAAVIYRKAVKHNLIRGRSIEKVAAASLYAACRSTSLPRTLSEIAYITGSQKKDIGRAYRVIRRYVDLNVMPARPEDYVSRFCSRLNLSSHTRAKAIELLEEAESSGKSAGKGPTGEAAAAIYAASFITGEVRTQTAVARVAGVTEVTIRNRYKDFSGSVLFKPQQSAEHA